MGQMIRAPDWRYCETNYTGTPSVTPGTTVTAGASNADGTAATLLSALGFDCEYLIVGVDGYGVSTENSAMCFDLLVDPAGGTSWTPLINDLLGGFVATAVIGGIFGPYVQYHFPLWIKSGTSIGARARRGDTTTAAGRVHLAVYGGNRNPGSWWCGQAVESIGTTPASSRGTNVVPGATGVFGSWTNIGSTLAFECRALQFACVPEPGTALNNRQYFYEFGVGSQRIGPPIYSIAASSEESANAPMVGPIWRSLAAGTQLQARGTSSGSVVANRDVAAYAVR